MKNGKWIFALLSAAALLAMVGIGLAVALDSIPLILAAIAVLCAIMIFGFRKKRQMIGAGLL